MNLKNDRYYSRIDEIENINIISELVCREYNLGILKDTFVI